MIIEECQDGIQRDELITDSVERPCLHKDTKTTVTTTTTQQGLTTYTNLSLSNIHFKLHKQFFNRNLTF